MDTKPPIPTLADGGHLSGSPLLFLMFFKFLVGNVATEMVRSERL
jgi:hypothetical protein